MSSPISAHAPGLQINLDGTFTDRAAWMYRTAERKFRNGPTMRGTNELLVPDAPQPASGEEVSAISYFHHPMNTMGYPLHISLFEKSFVNAKKIEIYDSKNSNIWKYSAGRSFDAEERVVAPDESAVKAVGPMRASGTIPVQFQAAFDFSKGAISALVNLPDGQKDMANYVVLFVDTSGTIWIEFAPLLAPDEKPHLGCQTQLGRDMVFGYPKKSPPTESNAAPWIQCF